jgi:hypothetical protein
MSAASVAFGADSLEREGASAGLLAGAVAVSGFAAWAIPGNRLGFGAVLVAAGIAALVISARAVPLRPDTVIFGGFALALASMAAVRSAEWLLALDGLAAAGLAAVAVTGASRWPDVRRAPLAVASRAVDAAPYLGRGARELTAGRRFTPALRGAGVGAALLAVFGALFISADRAFAELAHDFLLPDIDLALVPPRALTFSFVALSATALVLAGPRFAHLGSLLGSVRAATIFREEAEETGGERRDPAPIEWILALGMLDLLFLGFVVVQIAVLFAGHDYVLRTAGLTYAEYARQGFFQLVVVAGLTLAVVAGASGWARPRTARHEWMLKILLGVLLLLTLVVLASALKRLLLYEDAFGFTTLRISVHAVILWLAGVLVMVMAAGLVRSAGRWLPRALLAFSAAALLTFNLSNPDGLVARWNVERYFESGGVDLAYLDGLSADAVPALAELPYSIRECGLKRHRRLRIEPDTWPAWNLARARARTVLESTKGGPCWA